MATIGQKIETDPLLSEVLGHFYLIHTPWDFEVTIHHLSPSLEMLIVFNFGDPVSFSYGNNQVGERTIDHVGILGPLRQMMNYKLKPQADLLILPFIYDGFYRFLSLSIGEHADVVKEEDLLRHTDLLEEIWQMLSAIPQREKRVEKLQAYLIENLAQSDSGALPLLENVPAIHNPGLNPVNVMASTAALSERTIQIRFKKYVGYSPKELLRFLRFKQVVSYMLKNKKQKVDWIEMAIKFGYFDQSHLIKDFKYYTGAPPKEFLKLNEEGNFCVSRD